MGHILSIIDASLTGELFSVLSGYGGRTERILSFRQTDYILCNKEKELKEFLLLSYQKSSVKQWIYTDIKGFLQQREIYKEYKKIVFVDSFFHSIKNMISLIKQKDFYADLLILRGLPTKKITFSYFCRVYQKEFQVFKKILELSWAEEDLEYRVQLEYEPSQGFSKLSEGYHNAVVQICMEAEGYKGVELKKIFRTFEKNDR